MILGGEQREGIGGSGSGRRVVPNRGENNTAAWGMRGGGGQGRGVRGGSDRVLRN